MPTAGLQNLKHIVVLMMENRSFDHMLGCLKAEDPRINGLTGSEFNLDTTNEPAKVQPKAGFQGQLDPDPNHHLPAVYQQLFEGTSGPPATPSMGGFVRSYYGEQKSVEHSRKIMYYFSKDKLPVLTSLARSYAVFNGWFSSIPGPTLCNRAFAHYGTSFGQVGMDIFYYNKKYLSIYERMVQSGRTAKLYYFDESSSTMEVLNLLQDQPKLFGTFDQFLADCKRGQLPDYSFVEPNYTDHSGDDGGELLAGDQHPDHDVRSGELFIAMVYNAIRQNPDLWKTTALLIVYDEHGGIYDHVPPPYLDPKFPDGFPVTGTDEEKKVRFAFDRLGVRVPAILVSPWVPRATVISGPEDSREGKTFEHASIPATVTDFFLPGYARRTLREQNATTFLGALSDHMRPDADCPVFNW